MPYHNQIYRPAKKLTFMPLRILIECPGKYQSAPWVLDQKTTADQEKYKKRKENENMFPKYDSSTQKKTSFPEQTSLDLPPLNHVLSFAENDAEEFLDLNQHLLCNPQSTFFLRMKSDGMIEAGIHPGDLLVVDRSVKPENGKIVVAMLQENMIIQRFFKEQEKTLLVPANPAYSGIELTDRIDFVIWGVVTNVIHPL